MCRGSGRGALRHPLVAPALLAEVDRRPVEALGPGAPPLDRLLSMGRSRMELNLTHAELMAAAGWDLTQGSPAAHSFIAMHVRHLLSELNVRGDLQVMASALIAPLAPTVVQQQIDLEGLDLDRIHAGWSDLVERVVKG